MTWVPPRFSIWSWVNPLRCSSPASVTWVSRQVQRLELGQPFEVFQPGVRDLGAYRFSVWSWVNPLRCSSPASVTWVPRQVQRLELGQPFEVFQPGVRDLGVAQVQRLELGQPFEVLQPGVRDLGARQVQRLELGQPFEVLQPGVRDLGVPHRSSVWSWVNPLRCSSPASVTLVPDRSSVWSWVNPLRCSSPASVTWVALRSSVWSWVNPLRCSSPASVTSPDRSTEMTGLLGLFVKGDLAAQLLNFRDRLGFRGTTGLWRLCSYPTTSGNSDRLHSDSEWQCR